MKHLLILLAAVSLSACSLEVAQPELDNPGPSDPATETFTGFNPPIELSKMIKTETGVYYRDDKLGTGTEITSNTGIIVYRFVGFLKNGRVFGLEDAGGQVQFSSLIGGMRDAMRGMKVGGERTMVIPSEMAYGVTGNAALGIPGNATVIFDVILDGVL